MTDFDDGAAADAPYTYPPRRPTFGFGLVFSNSFSGFFKNIGPVLLGALIISALGALVPMAGDAITPQSAEPDKSSLLEHVIGIVTFAYLLYLGCLYYGFCMDMSYRTLLGYTVSFKQSAWRSLSHAFPLMIIAVLFWVGVFLGYMALVVPGLILTAGWALPGPAQMFGGASILGSFKRSWNLTHGYKWWVWLINFLIGIIVQIAAFILLIIFGLAIGLSQQADLVAETDPDIGHVGVFLMAFVIMLTSNLIAGLYGSMKAAIYAECLHLQSIWMETPASDTEPPRE